MTRRLFVIVLVAVAVSGVQGSLLYAAAAPSSGPPGHGGPLQASVAEDDAWSYAGAWPALADTAAPTSIECLRGASYCFEVGTWNCCGELFTLLTVSSALQAWLAAGLAAAAYYYYNC